MIPRILIGAAQSGAGKTTLTLGLVAAWRRRGLKVQTFKVGPDYLDPTWLAAASGRPCYNLDGWMHGRDYVARLFSRISRDADLVVVEGAMGLFDGVGTSGREGSSAQIAQWLQAPVVLAVNAHGMGRSLAPLVAGFAGFDETVRVEGVIANYCGSDNHREILSEVLAPPGLPTLLGAVPRLGFPQLPSRHLGLVTADPAQNCSSPVLAEFADAIEQYVDLDEMLRLARRAAPFYPASPGPGPLEALPNSEPGEVSLKQPVRLAVARDKAFHFYYQDLFDQLEKRGCRLAFFSPLRDPALPEETDAVYIGGGYPEEFADTLAANDRMLDSLRRFARSGRPFMPNAAD